MGRSTRSVPLLLLALGLPALTGCVHVFHEAEVVAMDRPAAGAGTRRVESPIRVHLFDGSIVVFEPGSHFGPDGITGVGHRYSLGLADTTPAQRVAMDSVVGVETYRGRVRNGPTIAATLLATVAIPVGIIALACVSDPKCFGSCPTIYTDVDGDTILEAELFSYSIAPLLEMRDLDVLHARARDGRLRLDVRNEALETHHINHVAIVEVLHDDDERALVDERERAIVVRGERAPATAVSRDGRDVRFELSSADDSAYVADPDLLAAAAASDGELFDHVEIAWALPADGAGDTAAITLRARNSLLTSVLFYEVMLASAGPAALDWMGGSLDRIGNAVELGAWWHERMGLHVDVWDGEAWRNHARLVDSGPIAWTRAAVRIPLDGLPRDSLRVRLRFVADQWRVDQVALATDARTPATRTVDAARLTPSEDARARLDVDRVLAAIARPDDDYLETVAGTRFHVEFDVGAEPAHGTRTFLLSSQGWYSEWMRPDWLARGGTDAGFTPGDVSLRRALDLWRPMRADFERAFHATRIPVR